MQRKENTMTHYENFLSETAQLKTSSWENWLNEAQKLCGHSLDGDMQLDGYSLDDAYEWFKAKFTPEDYAKGYMESPIVEMRDCPHFDMGESC